MLWRLTLLVFIQGTIACGPSVKSAGHTLKAEETAEKVGSSRRPAEPPRGEPSGVAAGSEDPPVAPGPTEEPLYAEIPEGGRLIGESGPVAIEGLGAGGHWVAHCSVPSGSKFGARGEPEDAPALHLTVGEKTERIDALLRHDERGRFVVALIAGKAWLIDATTNERVDLSPLSPDLRHDRLADHRSFAFTKGGLVLLSSAEKGGGYFLPWPPSGALPGLIERAIPVHFGARPVWRLEGRESSLSATVLSEGSTEKDWPVPKTEAPTLRCRSPSGPYDAFERVSSFRPDPAITLLFAHLPLREKLPEKINLEEAPGYVGSFRDGWVRREESGRLLLVRGKTQEQIASAKCGARILRADVETGYFLIACEEYTPVAVKKSSDKEPPKYRFELYLIRPGSVHSLKADMARTGVDYFGPSEKVLFPIRPGALAALVDFDKRRMIELDGDVQVLLTNEKSALLRRGNRLASWTASGEKLFDGSVKALDPVLIIGQAASIGATMWRLDEDISSWTLPGPPLAISSRGHALIPKAMPSPPEWPQGPLLLIPPSGEEP